MCYHRVMRGVLPVLLVMLTLVPAAQAADPLTEARRLYNAGQYEAAERAAQAAMAIAGNADPARIVLGRVRLERFRQTADPADLSTAREALRTVDARTLDYTERLELTIGEAEVLFLDDRFGAAAELFASTLDSSVVLGALAHERVLDWWASARDRHAHRRAAEDRPAIYQRIIDRMEKELAVDPGSTPGGYWLVAAARGAGDLERAWQAAIAGWVRASLAHDRGAALRADLDRLVSQAIIPERAARLEGGDVGQAISGMQNEWDAFKAGWSR
jgi:hypothetical protein